jgi:hypothetical protein
MLRIKMQYNKREAARAGSPVRGDRRRSSLKKPGYCTVSYAPLLQCWLY